MPFTCALYLRQKIVFLIFGLQTLLKLKSTEEQSVVQSLALTMAVAF